MKKLTRICSIISLLKKWGNYCDADFSNGNAIYACDSLLSEQQKRILTSRDGVKILVSKNGEKNAVLVRI